MCCAPTQSYPLVHAFIYVAWFAAHSLFDYLIERANLISERLSARENAGGEGGNHVVVLEGKGVFACTATHVCVSVCVCVCVYMCVWVRVQGAYKEQEMGRNRAAAKQNR